MGKVYDTAIYCQPAYLTSSRVHHAKCQLDESQAGINIVGRNINNLTYADATTLVVESEEELETLDECESEKAGLKSTLKRKPSHT